MGSIEKAFNVLDLIKYAKEHVGDYDRSRYAYENYSLVSDELRRRHQVVASTAMHLLERVVEHGGSEDEIRRASEYFLVALDSVKHGLNPTVARRELGIEELRKKYPRVK